MSTEPFIFFDEKTGRPFGGLRDLNHLIECAVLGLEVMDAHLAAQAELN